MQQPNRWLRIGAWFTIAMFTSNTTWAGAIVLADAPIINGLAGRIAPNILFILDDSTSMEWEYMPDGIDSNDDRECFRNFGYNTIYYNPNVTYLPPVNADGSAMANVDFNDALEDGFDEDSDTVNLGDTDEETVVTSTTPGGPYNLGNNPFRTYDNSRTVRVSHPGHGFSDGDRVRFTRTSGSTADVGFDGVTIVISSSGSWYTIDVTSSDTYTIQVSDRADDGRNGGGNGLQVRWEQYTYETVQIPTVYYTRHIDDPLSPPGSCEGDSEYERVYPLEGDAAEQANFANWYSYYRSRMLMMKTASGRAFAGLTDDYRVGFTAISDKTVGSGFLGVQRFSESHRADWYEMLYSASPRTAGGGIKYTPLRGALSKAGRYYAGRLGGDYGAGGSKDPIQYSCQQNFSILTTDGYWNTNNESSSASGAGRYGAYQMDNATLVGNADGSDGAPWGDSHSNTLADIAAYYYKTDLRSTAGLGGPTDDDPLVHVDVSENNVPETNGDGRRHQRMRTFTLGLGVDGVRSYPGDWAAIQQGSLAWPNPIANSEEERIDDLWHAAVNGRGQYMSAKSANAVEEQLSDALQSIRYEPGSSAAAATSTLQPVEGDNTAFIAQYQTGNWIGDLLARSIDVTTGVIDTTGNVWSAREKLDAMVSADADTRTILTFDSTDADDGLKSFEPANLSAEIAAGYFSSSGLSQEAEWSTNQRSAATATAMINYLRGRSGNEMTGSVPEADHEIFRDRLHVLGDIGSAAPVFVRKPPLAYLDAGYAQFISDNAGRAGTVYVGANDGMLHAFDGTTEASGGTERWAYIPSMVMPNLYQLADGEYATRHRYFVDGPIAVGDAYNSATSTWSTILVGGLGHGGKGYYALDVTDPEAPKALWEFNTADDNDIGYSYGNPVITKRAVDGKWVVLFASGYNNGSDGGDGRGRLFVIDAFSGAKLSEILTDAAVTDESLSGIARISNYVEDGLKNNSTQYVYGGDLGGSLWRFNINVSCDECDTAAARLRLARTTSTPGVQPITVLPELAKIRDGVGAWHRVVYFGTGRALGPNDLTDSDPSNGEAQAVYAVKDINSYVGVLSEEDSDLVEQTLRNATSAEIAAGDRSRKIDPLVPVDWQLDNGWYITVPNNERFTVDPGLQLGTLVIASNIHEKGYCEPTGSSVLYQLDYRSGNVLKTNEYSAQIVGITQLQTRGGAGPVVIDPVFADGTTGNTAQVGPPGGAGTATRVSWREIE